MCHACRVVLHATARQPYGLLCCIVSRRALGPPFNIRYIALSLSERDLRRTEGTGGSLFIRSLDSWHSGAANRWPQQDSINFNSVYFMTRMVGMGCVPFAEGVSAECQPFRNASRARSRYF